MKNIKKNEQINSPILIIPARYLSIILILIFVVFGKIAAAEQTNKLEARDSWKEIKLVLDTRDYSWCGNSHIVFSGHRDKGIRLYDLNNGTIQEITNDRRHRNVSCTADGRYIVFTDDVFGKNEQGSLFVYDRNTSTMRKMYMMDSFLLVNIASMPLSPYANYLLGSDLPEVQKYVLPGGKEVKLVPLRAGTINIDGFEKLQWSVDEKKLFILDIRSDSLTTYDTEKARLATSFIRVDGSSHLTNMRITKDCKLYVTALFGLEIDEDGFENLYLFDLENPGNPYALLVHNIDFYDVDDEGNVVYSKRIKDIKGVSYLEKGLYYLKRGEKQAQLLKKFNVLRNAVISPKISRNGAGVIFRIPTKSRDKKEFTILIKRGN